MPAPSSSLAVPQAVPRLAALDAARGVAVLGAVLIHALIAAEVWSGVPQTWWKGVLNAGFRAFTPTFFIIFGIMLELVYVRRAEIGTAVAGRLLRRAGWCWLGFVAGAVTATLFGHLAPAKLLPALLLVGDAPWSSVLRFYVVVLVLAIGLVQLRLRLGIMAPWLMLALIWSLAPCWSMVPWPWGGPGEPLRFWWGSTFGTPPIWVGGSVWHNLCLVAVGLILGGGIRARIRAGRSPFPTGHVFFLAGICLATLAACALAQDPFELVRSYAGDRMALRAGHHPAYYAGGALSAMLLLALLFHLVRGDGGFLAEVGRRSLVLFAASGVLLNAVPAGFHPRFWQGVLIIAVQMVLLLLLVVAVRRRAELAA